MAVKQPPPKPLPCPFCGVRPTLDSGMYGPLQPWAQIACASKRCPAAPFVDASGATSTEDEAIADALRKWNKRKRGGYAE